MPSRKLIPLSERELALVHKYGPFYRELDGGHRTAETEAQKHFIAVCRGRAEAETPHEIAYMKFRELELNNRKMGGRLQKLRNAGSFGSGASASRAIKAETVRKTSVKAPAPRDSSNPMPVATPKSGASSLTPKREAPSYARFIDEPLGTREDFKKDSGQNWGRAQRPKF